MSSTPSARRSALPTPPGCVSQPSRWWLLGAAALLAGGSESTPATLFLPGAFAIQFGTLAWFMIGLAAVVTIIALLIVITVLRRAQADFAEPVLDIPRGDSRGLAILTVLIAALAVLVLFFTFGEH